MKHVERAPGEYLHGTAWMLVFASWGTAGLATLGAFFLSEYKEFSPCILCWYQRVFLFPLIPILMVGLFTFDRRVLPYGLTLASIGWLIGAAHLLLMAGVLPAAIAPCAQAVPCSAMQITWFGSVTTPLLSVVAFSLILVMLIMAHFEISK